MSILLIKNRPPFSRSRDRLGIKIPKTSKTRMVRIPYDYVVENFDFKQLTSSNEVTSDLDVRF